MVSVKEDLHKQHCQWCGRETNHRTRCHHVESNTEEYHFARIFSVVECCGCEHISFRQVFRDFESAFPVGQDDWEVPEQVDVYPHYIQGREEIDGLFLAPDLVQSIYSETLLAVQEKANTLAGLGLRGTIEAICNDRQIKGRNLEIRISALQKAGLISVRDAERLNAIRFLGNDAAHDIYRPTENQINVALDIVEHLILSVYILDSRIEGRLDTLVTQYEGFVRLLDSKVEGLSSGDELPLAAILRKDIRRVQGALPDLQKKLIEEISNGTYGKLTLGKIGKFQGSNEELQHYIKP